MLLCSGASAAEKPVIIDQVEISGVKVFTAENLQASIEVQPGDKLDRAKVIRTVTNLQILYRSHGYEQVKIRTQLGRRKNQRDAIEEVLEILVLEGLPTRISFASIIPESLAGPLQKKYWNRIAPSLAFKLSVRGGDLFDQERLNNAKREIQDILASNEFVGARVDEVRISDAERPPGAEKLEAAKWVSVEFHVLPGDRVGFGFRGNTIFTQSRLSALVEEQRLLGFGKDYVQAIRSRIEDEYRSLGYASVHIDTYTYDDPVDQERHVTYDIKEGPRVKIDSVEFDGNEAFTDEELIQEFYAKAPNLVQQGYYVEKDVQKAAELTVEWMKSKGYLSAKLVTINSAYLPQKRAGDPSRSVTLTIYVYEWDETVVQSVTVKGSSAIPQPEIEAILGVHEGDPLNLFAFSEGMEALKARFRARGYLEAKILNEGTDTVIKYSRDNRYADVFLNIAQGPQYRVSLIIIEGLSLTKEYVVRRELAFKEGEILEEPKLMESEARVRRFGFFSGVAFRVSDDPEREGCKIVRILVQEGLPGLYGGGLGYRNDLGVRAFGGVSYNNLWGMNHTIAIDAAVNRRLDDTYRFGEYQAQLAYVYPYFLVEGLTFRPNFSLVGREYIAFDAFTTSVAATFEKKFLPPLTGILTYSLERVQQETPDPTSIDNQILTIGSITATGRLDFRDNALSPSKGFYGTATFEFASPFFFSEGQMIQVANNVFDATPNYTRFQARADYFLPVSHGMTLYTSARMGFSRNLQPSGFIPLIKQFALGGAGSLRGFVDQELNSYNTLISGTQTYVNYRTQLDLPFSGGLRFGPFLDAANLQVDSFSLGNLRYGTGVGFHYITPVGPVNFDYGLKISPRPGEDSSQIYFSIGVL